MATIKDRQDKTDVYIIVETFKRLMSNWKPMLKAALWGGVFGIIVAFSIPREYGVNAKLAMENAAYSEGGTIMSIASMLGYGTGGSQTEAITPSIYNKIITSTPFVSSLFDVPLRVSGKSSPVTVYEYFNKHYRNPWWKSIFLFLKNMPKKGYRWFKDLLSSAGSSSSSSPYLQYTLSELDVFSRFSSTVSLTHSTETGLYSLNVAAQDPLVSVQLCDTILSRLHGYVYEYRQAKTRNDLEYTQKVHDEIRDKYQRAQDAYSEFMDHNRDIFQETAQARRTELENDVNLYFGLYTSVSQRLEDQKAQLQKSSSIFTVIQPASVPPAATKPNKMLIILASIALFVFAVVLWVLFVREYVAYVKENYLTAVPKE